MTWWNEFGYTGGLNINYSIMASRRKAEETNMDKTSFNLNNFDGSRKTSKFWLSKFEKVSKLKKWSSEEKAVHMCLLFVGEAELWFHTVTENIQDDYELLKESFKSRFLPTESDRNARYQEFIGLTQAVSESSDTYLEMVVRMGRELEKSDQEIMDKSIQGLMFNTRNFVISKEPKTMEDVKKYAKLGQLVGVSNGESVNSMDYHRRTDRQPGPQRRANNWSREQCHPSTKLKEPCRHCAGEYSHDPYNCRHRFALCYKCSQKGHIARACPRQRGQYSGSR